MKREPKRLTGTQGRKSQIKSGFRQLLSQTNRLTDGVNNRLLRKTLAPDNPGEAGGVLSLTRSLNNELLDTKMLD